MIHDFVEQVNRDCAQRVKDFLDESDSLAYFLGSGVSSHYYPTWGKLPQKLKDCYDAKGWMWDSNIEVDDSNFAQFESPEFQAYFQKIADHNSTSFIRALSDTFEKEPSHHPGYLLELVKTVPNLIVTLNFDISIQSAFRLTERGDKYVERIFPIQKFISKEREDTTIVFHLHGKCHEDLLENPEWIVLHKDGYDFAYRNGIKPIIDLLASIFLENDVLFLGTGLREPEMHEFLSALTDHGNIGGVSNGRMALLQSNSLDRSKDEGTVKELYKKEVQADSLQFEKLGIQCLRFFAKDPNFSGLNDIVSAALGARTRYKPTQKGFLCQ